MASDVVIVGAGLVGCALARALAGAGLRCALIDASAPPTATDAWDSRVYALSPATVAFLDGLGVWASVDRSEPVRTMKIFGDAGARLTFSAYESGVDRLATIAESGRLHRALWQSLQGLSNLSVHRPARPASLAVNVDEVEMALDGGSQLSTRLLVGADGLHSWVRNAAGIPSRLKNLEQRAVVANFACSTPHRGTAYQWFRRDGVLAWLPLPGDRVSMVWSTPDAHAAALLSMTPGELAARVADAGGGALGALETITPAAAFPLVRLHVPRRVWPRLALVGDAAQVIHPLAGQGVNLGFGDAEALAAVLTVPRAMRHDSGDGLLLRRFERARAEDILAMRAATAGLQALFEARLPGARVLRNAGLNLTDRLTALKGLLARRAMGVR